MSQSGEKLTLQAFLVRITPQLDADLGAEAARLRAIADHLEAHLTRHPALGAQVAKFRACLPDGFETLAEAERQSAIAEARRITEDIRQRWIDADAPPLVSEIDDQLETMRAGLDRLRLPGPEALGDAAARMDRLARSAAQLDGIETRYVPWVIGGALCFVIGLAIFLAPWLLDGVPFLQSIWTIIACLGALPAVAIHYAWTVLPRSRADAGIDALNQKHFLPHGGLYFPQSATTSAGVVLVEPLPPLSEGEKARAERRQHQERLSPFR